MSGNLGTTCNDMKGKKLQEHKLHNRLNFLILLSKFTKFTKLHLTLKCAKFSMIICKMTKQKDSGGISLVTGIYGT